MAVSLAPVALQGDPGLTVQLVGSVTPGVAPNSLTAIELRDYGVAFVATDQSHVKYLFVVPWSNVQYVGPDSNAAAFSFGELTLSASGSAVTLTLLNSTTVSCTAVDVRPSGVAYSDGVNPGPTFRPWSEIASLSQAV